MVAQEEEFPISLAEAAMLPTEEWETLVRRTSIDDYALYELLLTEEQKTNLLLIFK